MITATRPPLSMRQVNRYAILWDDGDEYYGITSRPIPDRVAEHYNGGGTWAGWKFANCPDVGFGVVDFGATDWEEARRWEQIVIQVAAEGCPGWILNREAQWRKDAQ